jgi:hypothetical protein
MDTDRIVFLKWGREIKRKGEDTFSKRGAVVDIDLREQIVDICKMKQESKDR